MFQNLGGGMPMPLVRPGAPQGAGAGYAQYGGGYQPSPMPQAAPHVGAPQGAGAGYAQYGGQYNPPNHAAGANDTQTSSAAFARQRLLQAQRAGYLPANFKIANTKGNLIGQWQQLSGGIGGMAHSGGSTDARSTLMQALAGLGGQFATPGVQTDGTTDPQAAYDASFDARRNAALKMNFLDPSYSLAGLFG